MNSTRVENLAKYKADVEITSILKLPTGTKETKTRGVQYGATTDGRMRQRLELHSSEMGDITTQMDTVTVTADNRVLQIFPNQKRVVEMSTKAPPDPYTLELAQILADVRNFSLEMRRDTLDGADVYVLDMALTDPALAKQAAVVEKMNAKAPIFARQKQWVDTRSHIVLQTQFYDNKGTLVTGTKYSNIKTDIDLAPNLFSAPAEFAKVEVASAKELIKETVEQTVASSLVLPPSTPLPQRNSSSRFMLIIINLIAVIALLSIFMYRRNRIKAALRTK